MSFHKIKDHDDVNLQIQIIEKKILTRKRMTIVVGSMLLLAGATETFLYSNLINNEKKDKIAILHDKNKMQSINSNAIEAMENKNLNLPVSLPKIPEFKYPKIVERNTTNNKKIPNSIGNVADSFAKNFESLKLLMYLISGVILIAFVIFAFSGMISIDKFFVLSIFIMGLNLSPIILNGFADPNPNANNFSKNISEFDNYQDKENNKKEYNLISQPFNVPEISLSKAINLPNFYENSELKDYLRKNINKIINENKNGIQYNLSEKYIDEIISRAIHTVPVSENSNPDLSAPDYQNLTAKMAYLGSLWALTHHYQLRQSYKNDLKYILNHVTNNDQATQSIMPDFSDSIYPISYRYTVKAASEIANINKKLLINDINRKENDISNIKSNPIMSHKIVYILMLMFSLFIISIFPSFVNFFSKRKKSNV